MARQAPTTAARDANLDLLQEAVDQWVEAETTRLENEVTFLRQVRQGRGAESAGSANLAAASDLLQVSIDDYIVARGT